MRFFPPKCLGTKGTFNALPTLWNNEPVPQVLKQVVNLSCLSYKSLLSFLFSFLRLTTSYYFFFLWTCLPVCLFVCVLLCLSIIPTFYYPIFLHFFLSCCLPFFFLSCFLLSFFFLFSFFYHFIFSSFYLSFSHFVSFLSKFRHSFLFSSLLFSSVSFKSFRLITHHLFFLGIELLFFRPRPVVVYCSWPFSLLFFHLFCFYMCRTQAIYI